MIEVSDVWGQGSRIEGDFLVIPLINLGSLRSNDAVRLVAVLMQIYDFLNPVLIDGDLSEIIDYDGSQIVSDENRAEKTINFNLKEKQFSQDNLTIDWDYLISIYEQ